MVWIVFELFCGRYGPYRTLFKHLDLFPNHHNWSHPETNYATILSRTVVRAFLSSWDLERFRISFDRAATKRTKVLEYTIRWHDPAKMRAISL